MDQNKKGTYDEPKLFEIIKMYEEFGFKIHLEPFNPKAYGECTKYMEEPSGIFQVVYTKK